MTSDRATSVTAGEMNQSPRAATAAGVYSPSFTYNLQRGAVYILNRLNNPKSHYSESLLFNFTET